MADDIELKKATPLNPVAQEFCELDETVVRFVTHEEQEDSSLVSPTVHGIMPIENGQSLVGTTVADTVKIRSMIGSGGMSSVYRGVQESINREVAVKVMHSHLLADDNAMLRFRQEAQAVGRLDHINIVKVHDFKAGKDGTSFLIMDLVDGISLSDAIMQDGPLAPERAIDIFTQACDGLQHAHAKGVIHRDLKPSNIMLVKTADGHETVKVLDFGIAKILPQEGDAKMKLTQTGEVFGSPLYMSPEQCMGKPVDQRSDVYSMGCLIYEALTGKPPLEGANAFDTFFKHTTEMPQSVKVLRGDFEHAREFDAIILKAMAKDPKDRYQTMTQLRNDLARLSSKTERSWLGKVSDDVEFAKRRFGAQGKLTAKTLTIRIAAMVLLTGTVGGGAYYYNNVYAVQSLSWDQLFVKGQDSFDKGDYRGATQQFEQALQKAGLDNAKVLPVLRELVDVQIAQGNMDSGPYAERFAKIEKERDETISAGLNELLEQFNAAAQETSPKSVQKLDEITNEMIDKANLLVNPNAETRAIADNVWQKVISTYETSHPDDRGLGYARALHAAASTKFFRGEYQSALDGFQKSAAFKKELAAKDPTHIDTYVSTLSWVGQSQEKLGQLNEAEQTFKECISASRNASIKGHSNYSVNNPKIAYARFRLAEFYQYAKKDSKAAKTAVGEAIRIYENLETQEPEEQANCYALLATIQMNDGDLDGAQENFQRAHDLYQPMHQRKSLFWLETLKGLAECKFARGDYAGAEPLYRRALATGMHFGFQHTPTMDLCMSRLAECADKRGAPVDESMRLGEMKLKIDESKHGANSPRVLHDYLHLFDLARNHHEKERAERFLAKAESVATKTGGEGSWDWIEVAIRRGQFEFDSGKTDAGEATFEDAVEAIEKSKPTTAEQKRLTKELAFQVGLRMKNDKDLIARVRNLE
ncbi:serine/threonine protein kinase [Candidatus Obscuribacterales bacterium]|nr:serine/threonine protein kinase [Candidatus Obscuribacterales bacterium]